MDLNQALQPIRPLTQLVGKIMIIVGILMFFGINIPFAHQWWEVGLAGWLMQSI